MQVVGLDGEVLQFSVVVFVDGCCIDLCVLFVIVCQYMGLLLVEQFGCVLDESFVGVLVWVDVQKQIMVFGVYVVGDVIVVGNIILVNVEGVCVGISFYYVLVVEDSVVIF